jgi:hypothetical protein
MTQMKNTLSPLAIKEFAPKIISDGHLYLRASETRNFYVMKPGVFIDPAFVKKHAAAQTVFAYEQVIVPPVLQRYQQLFKEWKYLQFEKDFRLKSLEIIQTFKECHSHEEHFLTFAIACFSEFNSVSHDQLLKLHEADLHLFQKSFYSAAFAVIIALCSDFHHYPMVKDFYNLTLTLDLGLCTTSYTYFVAEGCNHENQNPGKGKEHMLKLGASAQEIDLFLGHPQRSYEYVKNTSSLLTNVELAEVALYQHELSDGTGFPRGIRKDRVSNWEAVVLLADSMVEIQHEHAFERDVLSFISKFDNPKLSLLPVKRVFDKYKRALGLIHAKEAAG